MADCSSKEYYIRFFYFKMHGRRNEKLTLVLLGKSAARARKPICFGFRASDRSHFYVLLCTCSDAITQSYGYGLLGAEVSSYQQIL